MKWKTIDNWPNYEVSKLGNVRNQKTGVTRGLYLDSNGYHTLRLSDPSRGQKTVSVHRLVAKAFLPNPDNKPCVCHRNGNRADNRVENLYWGTYAENQADRITHGTSNRGNNHGMRKLCRKDIEQILTDTEHTNRQLAEAYDVGPWTISRIKNGHTWSHVYNEVMG